MNNVYVTKTLLAYKSKEKHASSFPTWAVYVSRYSPYIWVRGQILTIPAEEGILIFQRPACFQYLNLFLLQNLVPHIQICNIPNKRFCKVTTKGILVLPHDENPITVDLSSRISPRPSVSHRTINVYHPESITVPPANTHKMQISIIGEGSLIWAVMAVDNKGQEHLTLCPICTPPELKFIDKNRGSVGEDCGDLVVPLVPLDAHTHTHRLQWREVCVEASMALSGLQRKGQGGKDLNCKDKV